MGEKFLPTGRSNLRPLLLYESSGTYYCVFWPKSISYYFTQVLKRYNGGVSSKARLKQAIADLNNINTLG